MKTRTTYICEVCGREDESMELIVACEARPMEGPGYEVGDIVRGTPYGWWSGSEEWFQPATQEEIGREGLGGRYPGWPLFVVVDVVPYSQVGSGHEHRMVPVLYSPDHANAGNDAREWYGWGSARGEAIRRAAPQVLARAQARAAKLGPPQYASY